MSLQRSLFLHCKQGNLNELKRIVEVKEVDLNVRDCWDSTPLYYACLCGHKEVVEYLLQNGSKCEASTFDGERCLYGALTNDIRKVLQNWKQIHSTGKRRDRHYELLRQMFEDDSIYKDITFTVHGTKLSVHRCLLAARSQFFLEALSTKWENKSMVAIKHERVSAEVFKAMLHFLYLGRVDIKSAITEDLKVLANYCKLPHFLEEIESAEEKLKKLVKLKPNMGNKVKILTVESNFSFKQLSNDLRHFAESAFPTVLRSWIDEGVLPFSDNNNNPSFYADICIEVCGHQFLCHKAFLSGQSEYFKALIRDHFNESESDHPSSLRTIKLCQISAEIFRHVLIYVYSGTSEFQSLDQALDILPVADMMLLPGLKRLCGNILAKCLEDDNVVAMYRYSRAFFLPILEDKCTSYMAKELDFLIELDEFAELVTEEANSVKGREETDSIPIVDEIRYRIIDEVKTYGQIEEGKTKLARLDAMLSRLGLEC